jgi:hypothetical protein
MPCPIEWRLYPETDPVGRALIILRQITSGLTQSALRLDEAWLARIVFSQKFMPYAKRNWQYSDKCNCGDLADAFGRTWKWVKRLRAGLRPPAPPSVLQVGVVNVLNTKSIIKNTYRLFAPAGARGNVRGFDGNLTGRCYFPEHWVCKIGSAYYDPTFDRLTTTPRDLVEREVTSLLRTDRRAVLVSTDLRFIYTRRAVECPPFADSWNEIEWAEALKHRGQVPRLPEPERIPPDIWQEVIRKSAARP